MHPPKLGCANDVINTHTHTHKHTNKQTKTNTMSHTHLHSHPLSLSANLLQKKKNIIFYHCAFPFIPAAKSFPLYICTSEETLRAHTISSSDHCGRLKKEERNEEKEWKEKECVWQKIRRWKGKAKGAIVNYLSMITHSSLIEKSSFSLRFPTPYRTSPQSASPQSLAPIDRWLCSRHACCQNSHHLCALG